MAYRATPRTEARKTEIRNRILTAARSLVADGGFAELRVTRVAEQSGVAIGTLYRHFASREALAVEVFERASQREVDTIAEAATPGTVEALRGAVVLWCTRAQQRPVLARALIAEPVDEAVSAARLRFRSAYAEVICSAIERCIATGQLPPQPARVSAACIVGALGEAVLGPPIEARPESIATFCIAALRRESP